MSLANPTNQHAISRRVGAPKSRSGCKTCKIRKVKCGEERPSCLRCTSTGRKCDFESERRSPQGSSTPPAPVLANSVSTFPNSGQRERRAFEYYFQHTAQHLAGGMKVDFWTSVIPQICRSEPAVWDGMIAISTLFEYPNQSLDFTLLRDRRRTSDSLNQIQREALTWYSRSISSVHSQIERGTADPYIILVSCVLFICVETIQGRMEEALQLFKQGVTLIFELRAQIAQGYVSASKVALLERAIIPLFLRLGSISLTISGTEKSIIFAFAGNNLNSGFLSVEDARTSITVLSAEVLMFEREAYVHLREIGAGSTVNPEMKLKKDMLQLRLAEWHDAYTKLLKDNNNNHASPLIVIDYEPLLPIYHAALSIVLASCLNPLESLYDSKTAEFEKIIEQSRISLDTSRRPDGSQPPFSFEAGVGVPLFLTALKCREPRLRRNALQLLREAPQMQGLFKCAPSALLAEAFMHLEEGYHMTCAHSTQSVSEGLIGDNSSIYQSGPPPVIPEEARIHYYCVFRPSEWRPSGVNEEDIVKSGCSSDQLFLHFSRNRFDAQSQIWVQVFECIPFGGDM